LAAKGCVGAEQWDTSGVGPGTVLSPSEIARGLPERLPRRKVRKNCHATVGCAAEMRHHVVPPLIIRPAG